MYIAPGTPGKSEDLEVDFYNIPKVKMNLSAMVCCTKHGLWQSDYVEVKVND